MIEFARMKKKIIAALTIAVALCLVGLLLASTFAAVTASMTIPSSGTITSGGSTSSGSGITRIQTASGCSGTYGSTISISLPSAPLSGDTLIMVVGVDGTYGTLGSVSTVSESGATWTNQVSETYSSNPAYLDVEIWVANNLGSGVSQSITVTLSGTDAYGAIAQVCEYSGILSSTPLDKTAVSSGTSTSTSTGTTATTAQATELWVGGIINDEGSQSSPTNGFVAVGSLAEGGAAGQGYMSLAYLEKIVAFTGEASSGTTGGGGYGWCGCIATFKAASTSVPSPSIGTITVSNNILGQVVTVSIPWSAPAIGSQLIPCWNNTGSFANQTAVSISTGQATEGTVTFSGTWTTTLNSKVTVIAYLEDSDNHWASASSTFALVSPSSDTSPVYVSGSVWTVGQLDTGEYYSINSAKTVNYATTYASTLINNAISATSSAHGILAIRTGYYCLDAALVPESYVQMNIASGANIYQNAPSALGDSISLMLNSNGGVSNFTVNGGVWNGNKGSLSDFRTTSTWNTNFFSYFGISIYSTTTSSNIVVEHLIVENVIGQGIDLLGCQNACVHNCTVINAGDNPITLDEDTSNSTVNDCTVIGGQDVGINTWQASGCTLENNHVANVTEYSGASHWGMAAEQSTNIRILDNIVTGCPYDIVDTSTGTIISGNTVSWATIGIQEQTCSNCVVEFNTFGSGLSYQTLGTYTPITQTMNLTVIGNVGLGSSWYTLNVTVTGLGHLSETESTFDQSLVSVNGNNYQFEAGDTVTLTAYPNSGQTLKSLTLGGTAESSPLSVTMNSNQAVVASFSG
jgi:hypothetical protein